MKIILEFNDEEIKRADQSFHGPEYAMATADFQNYLRGRRKYNEYSADTQKVVEEIEQAFYEIFEGLTDA